MERSKKHIYIIIAMVAIRFSLFGSNFNDTTITIKKTTYKIANKFSIGIGASLFSMMKYTLPHYSNLNPEPSQCYKCEPYKKPTYLVPLISDYQYLQIGYLINKNIKLNVGVAHIHEGIGDVNYNIDTLRTNVTQKKIIGIILNKYISVSSSITFSIRNNEKELFYTNIEAGANIDFIYHEYHKTAYENVDSIYSPYGSNDFVEISQKQLPEEPRANKLSFNRISPFLHLYEEWFNENKTVSFSLGSAIIFRSIYQLDNTAEFYKCYKITPIILGLSFHF